MDKKLLLEIKELLDLIVNSQPSTTIKGEIESKAYWILHHDVRVNSQGIELLETGNITFPRPDRQLLLDIKLGKYHYNEVADIIVEGLERLNEAQAKSSLRDKPDQEWIDNFIERIYTDIVWRKL